MSFSRQRISVWTGGMPFGWRGGWRGSLRVSSQLVKSNGSILSVYACHVVANEPQRYERAQISIQTESFNLN